VYGLAFAKPSSYAYPKTKTPSAHPLLDISLSPRCFSFFCSTIKRDPRAGTAPRVSSLTMPAAVAISPPVAMAVVVTLAVATVVVVATVSELR
jgi:hypothetical protein